METEQLWRFCIDTIINSFEGGFQKRTDDPGNWTGGVIGKGILKGTKYGISAAAHPDIEIESLTVEQAEAIYKRDYWDANRCGEMPARFALILFDGSVLQGVGGAAICLQRALGVAQDGTVGRMTLAAVAAADLETPKPETLIRFFRTRAVAEDRIMVNNPGMLAWAATWEDRMFELAWIVFSGQGGL